MTEQTLYVTVELSVYDAAGIVVGLPEAKESLVADCRSRLLADDFVTSEEEPLDSVEELEGELVAIRVTPEMLAQLEYFAQMKGSDGNALDLLSSVENAVMRGLQTNGAFPTEGPPLLPEEVQS